MLMVISINNLERPMAANKVMHQLNLVHFFILSAIANVDDVLRQPVGFC